MENSEATSPDAAAASAALSPSDQARIRRERRKAKVTQGADRLKKLTQTQKGPDYDASFKDDEIAALNKPPPVVNGESHDDPPVADIAEHEWKPRVTRRAAAGGPQDAASSASPFGASEDEFRQLMAASSFMPQQQQQQQQQQQGGQPGMGPQMAGMEGDPMMMLMQQLMAGGGPGGPGGPGGMPQMGPDGLPPGFASMFGGAQNGEQQASDIDPYAKWWTVLHSVCAMLLGVYAAWITGWSFKGSKEERIAGMHEDVPIFWYFATMELLLQSTRYILEKGRPPPGSILSKIGSFLPSPFGPFLITLARYSVIWSTVVNDGALLLFVLGVLSWWNSR